MRNLQKYTFVDLFAGAGGFTEGFLLAGNRQRFSLVAASDIHRHSCMTHVARFKEQIGLDYDFLTDDIRSPSFRDKFCETVRDRLGRSLVDVVVGGPPCQGFSIFGKRDEYDPRNDLFTNYLKIIQVLTPKYFVMENVPGFALMYEGRAVNNIRQQVESMRPTKYRLAGPLTINAAEFGVPQTRERILFIGSREDVSKIESVRTSRRIDHVTVGEAIGDLAFLRSWENGSSYHPDYPPKTKYQRESRQGRLFAKFGIANNARGLENHESARHGTEVIARFAMIEIGKGMESIPKPLWDAHLKSSKKWCVKLHPDFPSYTIVTLPDDFVHYERPRVLTVRELARLQSFDDTFVFHGPRSSGGGGKGNKKRNTELPQYSQVGNAVPPLMARGIAETILQSLDGTQCKDAINEIPTTIHRRVPLKG